MGIPARAMRAAGVFGFAALTATMAISANVAPVAAAAPPNVVVVRMHEFKFCSDGPCNQNVTQGSIVYIHTGDVVKWVWDESTKDLLPNCDSLFFQLPLPVSCPGHTTTSAATTSSGKPLWNSGTCAAPNGHTALGAAGCPFSVTFNSAGEFKYFCVFHGGAHANNPLTKMNGVIRVLGPAVTSSGAGGSNASAASAASATDASVSGVGSGVDAAVFVPGLPDTGAGPGSTGLSFPALVAGAVLAALTLFVAGSVGLRFRPRRH